MKTRLHYIILTILNAIAIPATAFLVYLHYQPEASTVCNLGAALNCDIVNKSIYAEIFGIPVAILGLITYLILLFFSIRGFFRNQKKLIPYLTLFTLGGVVFSLYLTYIEAFVLKTYCVFCVTQQIIILIQLGVFTHLWLKTKKS